MKEGIGLSLCPSNNDNSRRRRKINKCKLTRTYLPFSGHPSIGVDNIFAAGCGCRSEVWRIKRVGSGIAKPLHRQFLSSFAWKLHFSAFDTYACNCKILSRRTKLMFLVFQPSMCMHSLATSVPSVLWHCWLGHLTRKNPSPIWPIMCLVGR